MRNCPNCRREVSEEARYCRACYTVLPEIDPAVVARDRKRAKLISRFVKLSIIAAVGGAVWLIKSHPDLFTTAGAAAQRQWADVRSSRETRRTSSATVEMASAEEGESRPSHRPVNSPTVVHNGADGCAITQMVRNDSAVPLSPIVLEFTFENAAGEQVGRRLRAASDAVLPGRTDGRLAFQVPCPLAFSNVRVKPAEPAPATAALAKPVETAAAEAVRTAIVNANRIAVELPGWRQECDGNSPCPLTVSFGKGMSGIFMFQSAPGDSGELISDDPNLVALIARGERPVLKVPAGFAEVGEVVLTDENLQEKDKAGRWRRFVRWIRNSLGMGAEEGA